VEIRDAFSPPEPFELSVFKQRLLQSKKFKNLHNNRLFMGYEDSEAYQFMMADITEAIKVAFELPDSEPKMGEKFNEL